MSEMHELIRLSEDSPRSGPGYEDQWTDLAMAIIGRAFENYMDALFALYMESMQGEGMEKAMQAFRVKMEVEVFIRGAWYEHLTDISADCFIKQARERVKERVKEYLSAEWKAGGRKHA